MLHPLEEILLDDLDGAVSIAGAINLLPKILQQSKGLGIIVLGTEGGFALLRNSGSRRHKRLAENIHTWRPIEDMMRRRAMPTAKTITLTDIEVGLWVEERREVYQGIIRMALAHEELKLSGIFMMGTQFGIDTLERAPLSGARKAAECILAMPKSVHALA